MYLCNFVFDSNSIDHGTNVLILTSEGGQGHISAAQHESTIYQNCRIKNIIDENFISFDSINDKFQFIKYIYLVHLFLGHNWGKAGTKDWNDAQQKGDIGKLKSLFNKQDLADKLFGGNYYAKMYELLNKNPNTELVTTTQPIGIPQILEAIQQYNIDHHLHDNKRIEYKIVLTDVLTKKAVHFLQPLRQLDPTKLKFAKLILDVPEPPVGISNPSLSDFHKRFSELCPNLYISGTTIPKPNVEVNFTIGPIDNEFIKINEEIKTVGIEATKSKYKQKKLGVQFTKSALAAFKNIPHLKELLEIEDDPNATEGFIALPQGATTTTIMLGSKASKQGTLDALNNEYELNKDDPTKRYIFVFCGSDEALYDEICKKSLRCKEESSITIVPLSNQNKKTISHLYTIADTSVTRPGGMSVMELKAVTSANIAIFAELTNDYSTVELFKHPEIALIDWEQGNASSMIEAFGNKKVVVVNKLCYQLKRKEQLGGHADVTLMNKTIESFLTAELIEQCNIIFRNHSQQELAILKIASAIYKSKGNQDLSKMIIYAESYLKAYQLLQSEIINKYSLNQDDVSLSHSLKYTSGLDPTNANLSLHPNGWIMKFMDYINDEIKRMMFQNPGTSIYEIERKIHLIYPIAKAYANSFYIKYLNIISEAEAEVYLNGYKNAEAPDEEVKVEFGKTALDNYRSTITHSMADCIKIDSEYWVKGQSIAANVRRIMNKYINPWCNFFRRTDLIQEADQLIFEIEHLEDTKPTYAILECLINYKIRFLQKSEVDEEFLEKVRFIIGSVAKRALLQPYHATKELRI